MKINWIRWLNDKIIPWLVSEKLPTGMPLCSLERIYDVIQPGDVLLAEGKSRIGEVIKIITQSPWSHAALSIGCLDDIKKPETRHFIRRFYEGDPKEPLLIEALMDKGVVVTPLKNYHRNHLRICRPKGLSALDSQKVIHYAAGQLGFAYNVRQILDLARFLFPYTILPRRWRSCLFQHRAGEKTRAVCSSLLASAFMSVRFPVIPLIQRDNNGQIRLYRRNFRLYTPKDFDVSPYFEIIKYPLMGHDDLANYRNLPWATQPPELLNPFQIQQRHTPIKVWWTLLRRKIKRWFPWLFCWPLNVYFSQLPQNLGGVSSVQQPKSKGLNLNPPYLRQSKESFQ